MESLSLADIVAVEVLLDTYDSTAAIKNLASGNRDNPSSENEIKLLWSEVCDGAVELSTAAIKYFGNAFKLTPDKLMLKFSCDGIAVIPNLFPELPRIDAIEKVRLMFDRHIHKSNIANKEPAKVTITNDDRHIVEYIGGYILQRLMKRSEDMDYRILEELVDGDASPDDSLIKTYQNDDFGSLTVPSKDATNFMIRIEIGFRKFYSPVRTAETVLSNLNLDCSKILRNFPLQLDEDKLLPSKQFLVVTTLLPRYPLGVATWREHVVDTWICLWSNHVAATWHCHMFTTFGPRIRHVVTTSFSRLPPRCYNVVIPPSCHLDPTYQPPYKIPPAAALCRVSTGHAIIPATVRYYSSKSI